MFTAFPVLLPEKSKTLSSIEIPSAGHKASSLERLGFFPQPNVTWTLQVLCFPPAWNSFT